MFKPLSAKPFLAVILSTVLFTNCQTISSFFQEPVVSLRSVELAGISFAGIQLLCKVNVENPNPIEIPFPETDWEFFLNANSFVKGIIKNGQPIGSRKTTVVEVPVSFEYLEVFNTFSSLIGKNEADFKVALDMKFNFPILGEKVLSFQHEGILPLLQAPTLGFAGIKVKNVGLTAIDFDVIWEIENNNNFALNVKELFYDLAVNNSRWASGRVSNSPQIGANRKTQIPLTITINSLSMVRDLTDIITRGTSAAYSCNGNVSLGATLPSLYQGITLGKDMDLDVINKPFNFTGTTALR